MAKRKYKYDKTCFFCGKKAKIKAIEQDTWENVWMCDGHWLLWKDQQGQTVKLEKDDASETD